MPRRNAGRLIRFEKVALENWKNFAFVDIPLQMRAFLVGPNASGKSNFIDVFRFLKDLASTGGGFQTAVEKRGGVKAIRCLSARRNPNVAIRVSVSGKGGEKWEYGLSFNFDEKKKRSVIIVSETIRRNEKTLLERPNEEDKKDPERLTQTYLEQVNVNRPFRELVEFFQTIRYLHIVPQIIREHERWISQSSDPFGGDFLEEVATADARRRNPRLKRIKKALQAVVPQLGEIKLWIDNRGTPHIRGKYEHWRQSGAWQTEKDFSEGTLRLIGLLWALLSGSGPLLLEEPELSLHPGIVAHLPRLFQSVRKEEKERRQIFVSTHSPELLSDEGIGLDEVFLFLPGKEGTEVKPAAECGGEEIQTLLEAGVSLGEIVKTKTSPERADELPLFDM